MLISFIRAAILYFIIIILLRLIGKKQIGQLEPSELVLSLVIADLASTPMSDIGIPLSYGIVPILSIYLCEKIITFISLKSQKNQAIMIGKPSLLVKNGVIDEESLRKCDFTVNDLLEQLRLKNYYDLKDVGFAILETCGQLSVIPAFDTGTKSFNYQMALSLIIDGEVFTDNLKSQGLTLNWLNQQLEMHKIKSEDVFFAYLDKNNNFKYQVKIKP